MLKTNILIGGPVPLPTLDKYIVRFERELENTTSGGILMPETSREKVWVLRVVSVGPGKWASDGSRRLTPQFAEGDLLLSYKLSTMASFPSGDGGRYHLVDESAVLAHLPSAEAT